MKRLLLLLTSCLAAHHPELRGVYPDPADIDDGECVPIKCELGTPPAACTRLCALRHYLPVCQPPGDFCLCQRFSGGRLELVSPDEVLDQPSPLGIFAFIVPITTFLPEDEQVHQDPRRITHEERSRDSFRRIRPGVSLAPPTVDSYKMVALDSEEVVVNVHEGRLYWLFRYVLTGLFLLIVALVVFEVIMCQMKDYEKIAYGYEDVEEEEIIEKKKRKAVDIV